LEGLVSISACNWLILNYRQQDLNYKYMTYAQNTEHMSLPINIQPTHSHFGFFLVSEFLTCYCVSVSIWMTERVPEIMFVVDLIFQHNYIYYGFL